MNSDKDSKTKNPFLTGSLKLPVIDAGYDFMEGALRCLSKYVLIFFMVAIALNMVRNWLAWDTDDSDKDGWHRSGLQIHTDAKTGIQYLSDGHGGLVRREYYEPAR